MANITFYKRHPCPLPKITYFWFCSNRMRMSEVCLTIFQVNRAAFWKSYGQKYTVRHPYWKASPSSCQHRKGCMKKSITHMYTSDGSTRLNWRAPRHQSLQQKQSVICWFEYMYKVVINSVSFSWSWAPWILKPGPFCVSQVPGPRTTCLRKQLQINLGCRLIQFPTFMLIFTRHADLQPSS